MLVVVVVVVVVVVYNESLSAHYAACMLCVCSVDEVVIAVARASGLCVAGGPV
jgi:hypothetical protein